MALLQVLQHHHAHEVTDMQRVGRRVDAHIRGSHLLVELFLRAGHHVVNHASPFQFFNEIHKSVSLKVRKKSPIFMGLELV